MDNANSHVTLPQRLWQKISRSYRARISFAVALLIMLFLLIGFVEMYFFARKTLVEKTHDFMRSEAISCSNNIENSITEIEDVTLSLLGNTAIQNELNRKLTEHLDKYDVYLVGEHIRENLSSYALLRAEISSVQLLATDETVYSYSKNRSYLDEDALLAHKDSIYALGGRTMWFVYDGDGETLSCARAINYLPSQTTLGIVSVNITEKHIHSLYENLISPGVGDVFLLDQDGRVISSYNGTHLGELADNTFGTLLREDRACYRVLENGDSVYVSEKLRNNWRLLMTVPAAYYLEGINALGAIFLVSAILMIAAALVIVLRLTAHLTQPVNDLARAMEDFGSGNLDAHCVVTTDDEIGMLGKTFNKMISDMHQLYVTAYEQRLLRQDAELQALQMQINPHFLYNTLDTINWKARMSGNEDAGDMAYSLGCLLRHSLSPGEFTMLSKEIEALRHYLSIQNYRYSDRLSVDLDIDESFYNMDIPKLLIQPLVENAIIHGLEPKVEGGHIRIWAELAKGGDFLIHVEDDGVGMSSETQKQVLSGKLEQDFRKKSHIGVYNVHRRIQLFYGEGYGLEIRSAPGVGTCMTIRIRALREPEELL